MKIPGTCIEEGSFRTWYPFVEITAAIDVGNGETLEVDFAAEVDSGASRTFLPSTLLEAAAFDWQQLPPEAGRYRTSDGRLETSRSLAAVLSWQGHRFAEKATVFPAEPGAHAVLGRDDFFRAFRVDFSGWTGDPPSFNILVAGQVGLGPVVASATRNEEA